MAKPLDGIRILEWAVWFAGPGTNVMLGDLGAEVIKIEQPVIGDPIRGRGVPLFGGKRMEDSEAAKAFSGATANRNKKSITIDVTNPKGREIVYRLIPKCDVFLQNFRQGVSKRIKLGYDTLSQYNPKLIYANVSGYGPDGADNWRRGNDYIGQARSGFMSNQRSLVGEPAYLNGIPGDHMASIFAAYGILAALVARERLGMGQEIDASVIGSLVFLQYYRLNDAFFHKKESPGIPREVAINPLYNHYKCKDGKWIALSLLAADVVWPDFCQAVGIQNLEKDPKFENTPKRAENARELVGILDNLFASRTRAEWEDILGKYKRIMFSRINEGIEVADDPQMIDNKYVVEYEQPPIGKMKTVGYPVKFHKTPAGIGRPAPEFGQHTEEVLIELGGYSRDEIAQFKEEKGYLNRFF